MNNLFFYYAIIATCFSIVVLIISSLSVVLHREYKRKKASERNKIIKELLSDFDFKDTVRSIVNDEMKYYLSELKDTNKNE